MTPVVELRRRLERAFPLREFNLSIGPLSLNLTTANDIEELISNITEEEFQRDERLPYWAEVWHSAIALSEHLLENSSLVTFREVLEIGCGLGVPGIVAAKLGALMSFSDYDEYALDAAELNFSTNLPEGAASFFLHDFRNFSTRTWPVILAADVIYERRSSVPLVRFLQQTIEPAGRIILAEPNRSIAESFFKEIEALHFTITTVQRTVYLHSRSVQVAVHEIMPPGFD